MVVSVGGDNPAPNPVVRALSDFHKMVELVCTYRLLS